MIHNSALSVRSLCANGASWSGILPWSRNGIGCKRNGVRTAVRINMTVSLCRRQPAYRSETLFLWSQHGAGVHGALIEVVHRGKQAQRLRGWFGRDRPNHRSIVFCGFTTPSNGNGDPGPIQSVLHRCRMARSTSRRGVLLGWIRTEATPRMPRPACGGVDVLQPFFFWVQTASCMWRRQAPSSDSDRQRGPRLTTPLSTPPPHLRNRGSVGVGMYGVSQTHRRRW